MRWALLVLVWLLGSCSSPESAPPQNELKQTPVPIPVWRMHSVTLYLPPPMIDQRISATALSDYIKALRARAPGAFAEHSPQPPVNGAVVVMIRPGRQSRVWMATDAPMRPQVQADIEAALAGIEPPATTGGPVVFGLLFSAWGADMPPEGVVAPVPESWRTLTDGLHPRAMDDTFFEEVWRLGR